MLIPILILSSVAIILVERNISSLISSNTRTIFALSSNSLETLITEAQQIGIYIDSRPDLLLSLLAIFQDDDGDDSRSDRLSEYNSYLYNMLASSPFIHSVCIYKPGSPNMVVNDSIRDLDEFGNPEFIDSITRTDNTGSISRNTIKMNDFELNGTDVMTFTSSLKYGMTLSINITESHIRNMLDDATQYPDEIILLTDGDSIVTGNSAYIDLADDTGDIILDTSSYVIQSQDILSNHNTLVSMIPDSIAMGASRSIIRATLLITMVTISMSILISVFLSRNTYRKINDILTLFEKNDEVDEELILNSGRHFDTYHYILENIAKSYIRQTTLRERIVNGELDLALTQLTALQYQINPHFIFNTLQSIDLAIMDGARHDQASRMISLFSSILRYSLQDATKLVPLQDEINITRNYLSLQEMRFADRVMVLWDFEEKEIEGTRIIRMLFQPILENVFQHGMRADGKQTVVRIRISRNDRRLFIGVSDNGPGLEKAELDSLRKTIATTTPPEHHIGLYNVNRRLVLKFGENSAMKLICTEGNGLSIFISIPTDKTKNDTF